jgi:hypothetical protein
VSVRTFRRLGCGLGVRRRFFRGLGGR